MSTVELDLKMTHTLQRLRLLTEKSVQHFFYLGAGYCLTSAANAKPRELPCLSESIIPLIWTSNGGYI